MDCVKPCHNVLTSTGYPSLVYSVGNYNKSMLGIR